MAATPIEFSIARDVSAMISSGDLPAKFTLPNGIETHLHTAPGGYEALFFGGDGFTAGYRYSEPEHIAGKIGMMAVTRTAN